MFCKICYDAGNANYDNHNIRTNGIVTCQYLLSLKCDNCGYKGHTKNYCKSSANKSCVSINYFKPVQKPVQKPLQKPVKLSNAFAALECLDVDDDHDDIDDDYSVVSNPLVTIEVFWNEKIIWGKGFESTVSGLSWADAVCV